MKNNLPELFRKHEHRMFHSAAFKSVWGDNPKFTFSKNRVSADKTDVRSSVVAKLDELFQIDSLPLDIHNLILNIYNESMYKFCLTDHVEKWVIEDFSKDIVKFKYKNVRTYQHPVIKLMESEHRFSLSKSVIVDEYNSYFLYTFMGSYCASPSNNGEYLKLMYYVHDDVFHFNPPKIDGESKDIITLNMKSENFVEKLSVILKNEIDKKLFHRFHYHNLKNIFDKKVNHLNFNQDFYYLLESIYGLNVVEFKKFMSDQKFNDIVSFDFSDIVTATRNFKNLVDIYKMYTI